MLDWYITPGVGIYREGHVPVPNGLAQLGLPVWYQTAVPVQISTAACHFTVPTISALLFAIESLGAPTLFQD